MTKVTYAYYNSDPIRSCGSYHLSVSCDTV